ncbi:glucosaminidase domain-containing protein [Mangrovimonas sp. TPBH4]|uniref:glucosaminidase domain-containing protein n=1 Tax=Mangrovimonas sp. TPBH4 TaxID=1645914 RepID=UPI0006B5FE73|nr:glucosaminidase domain-containing protein [Mangrovimonas sp. TPBH4]
MKRIVLVALTGMFLVGCGSKRTVVTKKKDVPRRTVSVQVDVKPEEPKSSQETSTKTPPKTYASATEAYIANFNAIAMEEMRKYKIPASITLAQGILESGSGQARLAVEANNHFGIKCHGWTGPKIYHDDDASQECFRKYSHAESSFEDHSAFLTSRSRYAKLFDYKQDDYKSWARGLRAAGYATDRKYPEKLISLIERYQLYKYDEQVLGKRGSYTPPTKDVVASNDNVTTHEVVKGDTLYSISKRYNTTVESIRELNGMRGNDLSIGQMLIIKNN